MALKYFFQYYDVENVLHECEISDVNFVGTPTEISGRISLDYGETNTSLDAIRGQGLRVGLDASTELTFSDLYSEDEKSFSVQYKRDSIIMFNGWLNLEGLYQDYVNDKWVLSFDCVDGLSYLENLSFVQATGETYAGRQRMSLLIQRCLERTGILQNINVSIGIFWDGLAETADVLFNTYVNAGRFLKDDKVTLMSCDQVLRDTLELFNAVLVSHNGEWYIFRPNEVSDDSSVEFHRYDSNYTPLAPATKTVDLSQSLGSQINDFYPHHAKADQSITLDRTKSGYRINYKFGFVNNFFDNATLYYFNGWADFLIESNVQLVNYGNDTSGAGFAWDGDPQPPENDNLLRIEDPISLNVGDSVTVTLIFEPDDLSKGIQSTFQYQIFVSDKVLPDNSAKIYYLTSGNTWGAQDVEHTREYPCYTNQVTLSIETPPIIDEKNLLYVRFKTAQPRPTTALTSGIIVLQFCGISPTLLEAEGIEGEFHTFLRNNATSSAIEDVKVVFNADNGSEVYVGTIYKNDVDTPTSVWHRRGEVQTTLILGLMGIDLMRMNPSPKTVFSGSFYGYIPYMSAVTIDGFTGKFMFTKYSYDTLNNTTQAELKQIFNDDSIDIDYKITSDFGTVRTPTIRS